MKKQLYKLTAKEDGKDNGVVFTKGTEIYTNRPENYDLEKFELAKWDRNRPL